MSVAWSEGQHVAHVMHMNAPGVWASTCYRLDLDLEKFRRASDRGVRLLWFAPHDVPSKRWCTPCVRREASLVADLVHCVLGPELGLRLAPQEEPCPTSTS